MYISKELIFLQLQKTACTHIEKILKSYLPGETIGKHGPLTFDAGGRRVIGSIRNPFEWYVSLWSYGCLGRGQVHSTLTLGAMPQTLRVLRQRARAPSRWKEIPSVLTRILRHDALEFQSLYADHDDVELFRAWLRRVLQGPEAPYIENDYPMQLVDKHLGLYSYRFLRLFTDFKAWTNLRPKLNNATDVRQYYEDHAICSTFIRNERLEKDLATLLCDIGMKTTAEELLREKVKASQHRPYSEYYDNELVELVRNKDALICDVFRYDLLGQEAH
jgi:hypothetical protein